MAHSLKYRGFIMLTRVASSAAVILSAAGLSACSSWPAPEHREVTLDGISQRVQEYCHPDQEVRDQLTQLSAMLAEHQQQLVAVDTRLATPVPAVTAPPPPPVAVVSCKPVPTKKLNHDNKVVVGATEWIYLNPPGLHMTARIDTGAATSSISASNIVRFERDGKKWVSFDLDPQDDGHIVHMEAPLERNVRIRQASYEDIDRRPVVELDLMLGENLRQRTEFTLADRSRMSYPVLLGRAFLRDLVLVDVGAEYLHPKVEPEKP